MSSVADINANADSKMRKTLEKLKDDLGKVRTGRPHTGLLDHITVDYYGTPTPINQLVQVTLADARTIAVSPWEKSLMQAIEKAIRDSDLGLNPVAAGTVIRIPMPPLTEERRRDLVKVIKGEAENARIAVRNTRRDANQQLKDGVKAKTLSEDDEKRGNSDIQKITDTHIAEIEKIFVEKEKELLAF